MRRTTRSSQYDTSPRPIGQSFWLLSTMAIAVIIVMMMGEAFASASDSADESTYSSQELLDLANSSATTTVSPTASTVGSSSTTATDPIPAAPAASSDIGSSTTTTATPGTAIETPIQTPTETTIQTAATSSSVDDATEDAAPTGETDPTGSIEARGQAALATISYPWRQLLSEWTISFLPEKSGLYGLTMVPDRKIEIYVRENQSVELLAHVIAHELGHAVDVSLNDGPDRRRWEDARGLTSAPWWPGSGATDFSTGAGDFAESFAAWQVGDGSFRSTLGDAPTAAQITLLAELSAG